MARRKNKTKDDVRWLYPKLPCECPGERNDSTSCAIAPRWHPQGCPQVPTQFMDALPVRVRQAHPQAAVRRGMQWRGLFAFPSRPPLWLFLIGPCKNNSAKGSTLQMPPGRRRCQKGHTPPYPPAPRCGDSDYTWVSGWYPAATELILTKGGRWCRST